MFRKKQGSGDILKVNVSAPLKLKQSEKIQMRRSLNTKREYNRRMKQMQREKMTTEMKMWVKWPREKETTNCSKKIVTKRHKK